MEHDGWALGDCVVVKLGVTDPDTGSEIGGWQGRITAVSVEEAEGGPVLGALSGIASPWRPCPLSSSVLRRRGPSRDDLATDEVAPAAERDTAADVGTTRAVEIRRSARGGGEQGQDWPGGESRPQGDEMRSCRCGMRICTSA
jgi:hypothetical protein